MERPRDSSPSGPILRRPNEPLDSAAPLIEALRKPETPQSGDQPNVSGANDEKIKGKQPLRVQFDSQPPSVSVSGSKTSVCDDDDVFIVEAHSPDGGWGWIILIASFMVNLIADGVSSSISIFLPHILKSIGEPHKPWLAVIFADVKYLYGPIASFLTDTYGCRQVTVCGSILASIGFIISAFAEDMGTFIFTYAIMVGFGLSLCYVPAVVMVACYFEKKRSLTTAISMYGRNIGRFIFSMMTNILIDVYGWRGTMLMLAGFLLNLVVCGLLFRDMPWIAIMKEKKVRERIKKRDSKRKHSGSTNSKLTLHFLENNNSTTNSAIVSNVVNMIAVTLPMKNQFNSLVGLPTFRAEAECIFPGASETMSTDDKSLILKQNLSGSLTSSKKIECQDTAPIEILSETQMVHEQQSSVPLLDKASLSCVKINPLAFHNDPKALAECKNGGAMLKTDKLRASSCPNVFMKSNFSTVKERVRWYTGLWDFLELAVNPVFCVFAFSKLLYYLWYDIPNSFFMIYARYMGVDVAEILILIPILVILTVLGTLVLGWMGDWKCLNVRMLYGGCMVGCGVSTFGLVRASSWRSMCAGAGTLHLFSGADHALTNSLLVQFVTLRRFTNAYGLLMFIQGVAEILGPPVAGLLFEMYSIQMTFYVTSFAMALSGLLMFAAPLCCRVK